MPAPPHDLPPTPAHLPWLPAGDPTRPWGVDWHAGPAGPVGLGPDEPWAYGLVGDPVAPGSGSGWVDTGRYRWRELAPGADGRLEPAGQWRGTELGDYVVPLAGSFPEAPAGTRALLKRAPTGYWVAVLLATAATALAEDPTTGYALLECLDVPTDWYRGYVRDYGSTGPALYLTPGSGSGEADPDTFFLLAGDPRPRTRPLLMPPGRVTSHPTACQGFPADCGPAVATPCCPAVPAQLFVSAVSSCGCLSGLVGTLAWQPGGFLGFGYWVGVVSDPCLPNYDHVVGLECVAVDGDTFWAVGFQITPINSNPASPENPACEFPTSINAGDAVSCDPFVLRLDTLYGGGPGTYCPCGTSGIDPSPVTLYFTA